MFQPKELFIGLRYIRAKRKNHFVSFIAFISIAGVALGVFSLIVVLSVMNGFGNELRDRTLSMTSHATISGYDGYLRDWSTVLEKATQDEEVVAAAPYIRKEVMLSNGRRVSGSLIRGIEPEMESKVSLVASKMISGSLFNLKAGEYGIIIGRELANTLSVYEGDRVTVITPQASITAVGVMPRLRRFKVVGVFEVGMHQYDSAMAYIHLQDASKLFSYKDKINGVRLKLTDLFDAPRITRKIENNFGDDYWVRDWSSQHKNFFRALQTEKTVMFIILLMMVSVAALNIVSTLMMTVTDKESDIAILRALGMRPSSIMTIFIIQGAFIGFFGTLIGVGAGVPVALNVFEIVSWLEQIFSTDFLPSDVYYISDITADVKVSEVVTYALSAFSVTILATIYPAWRASRTLPAEALRYE
ncbi:Lipoprotein releasing system transmembrane protein LolC/LolE [hydrothermal vent metagenome]|uniref:Lipoprotein releasing system transmembrane protein LolC/LolE n=1 Tax=hydrothermal vent metagenome TaxID=652676 RepID=A0A3B0WKC7_9ZZZZ